MPNKSSPHGGFITEGTVSHGTLRQQDLLRSFAQELERVFPFNGAKLAGEAYALADAVDTICGATDADFAAADEVLSELVDQLDTIAGREGLYFGTLEGDASDFGFWRAEDDALNMPHPAVAALNARDFSQERFAVEALRNEGFALIPDTVDIWRSADGLIDAVVKQRFRDGRFYIVLFA